MAITSRSMVARSPGAALTRRAPVACSPRDSTLTTSSRPMTAARAPYSAGPRPPRRQDGEPVGGHVHDRHRHRDRGTPAEGLAARRTDLHPESVGPHSDGAAAEPPERLQLSKGPDSSSVREGGVPSGRSRCPPRCFGDRRPFAGNLPCSVTGLPEKYRTLGEILRPTGGSRFAQPRSGGWSHSERRRLHAQKFVGRGRLGRSRRPDGGHQLGTRPRARVSGSARRSPGRGRRARPGPNAALPPGRLRGRLAAASIGSRRSCRAAPGHVRGARGRGRSLSCCCALGSLLPPRNRLPAVEHAARHGCL